MFKAFFDFIGDSYTDLLFDNNFIKNVVIKSNCFFDKYADYKKVSKESTNLNSSICILGISNSGKTSYITALYYRMFAGKSGYLLSGKDYFTNGNLLNNINNLRNNSLKRDRFLFQNNAISKYSFDCVYDLKDSVISFDLYDYSGNIFTNEPNKNIAEYHNFKNIIINKSSSILIFIDSSFFLYGNYEEKVENIQFECASIFNSFIRDYIESGNKILPVSIVVTKYDLVNKSISDENLCNIIKESFNPLFDKKINRLNRIVSIVPVSLGYNISEKDYTGKLKPINIHIPLFFSLYFALDGNNKFQNYHREKLRREFINIPYLYKNGVQCSCEDI